MQTCKWCQLAQQLSKDVNGHIQVTMCRPCFRRKRKAEAPKERSVQTKKTR